MLWVSPQEQAPELRRLGRTHPMLEKHYGCDFMFAAPEIGLIGIQRKQFPEDFIASLRGGDRVSRELQMMKRLDMGIWILEGMGNWTNDGFLVYGGRYKYYEYELWGFQLSLANVWGYPLFRVRDMASTIKLIERIQIWANKPDHDSLLVRPKPGRWGEAGSVEWILHFLQGIPGVGVGMAKRIHSAFGRVPFKADFEYADMVVAVGPSLARTVCELFGVEVPKLEKKSRKAKVVN